MLFKVISLAVFVSLFSSSAFSGNAHSGKSCQKRFESQQLFSEISDSPEDLHTYLLSLYPGMPEAVISDKIAAAKNSYKFMRSFIPVFYDLVRREQLHFLKLKPLFKYQGHALGDIHPENFGVFLSDNGKAHFLMNDFDDSGKMPVVLDIVRFLTGIRLAEKDVGRSQIFSQYLKGLTDQEARAFKKPIRKLMEESVEAKNKIKKNDLENLDTLSRDKDAIDLSKNQKSEIEHWLKSKQMGLIDSYQFTKEGGGSGGSIRIRLLIEGPEGLQSIELKQLVEHPGYLAHPEYQAISPKHTTVDHAERYDEAYRTYYPDDIASRYETIQIADKNFLVRPRNKSNIAVSLSLKDFTEEESIDILKDEAYLLGQLHQKGLTDSKPYAEALKSTSYEEINLFVKKLSDITDRIFNTLRDD